MISDDPLLTFSGAQNSPPYSEGEEYPSGRSWWYGSDTWSSQRFEKTEFIFHSWDMSPGVHGAVLCQGLWQRDKRHAGKMLNVKAEPLQGKAQKVRMVAVYTGKKTDSGFAKTEAQRDHSLVQEQPIAQPEPEPTPSLSRLSQNSNTSLHSPQLSPSIQVGT